MISYPQFPPWGGRVSSPSPFHNEKLRSERLGQLSKVTWLAIRTQVSGLPARGHSFLVSSPKNLSHSQTTPCKKSDSCLFCVPFPTNSKFLISSLFLGAQVPGWLRAWLYQVHSSLGSGLGMQGEAPAPYSSIGNLPTEPPSFLLESALEFLCSQCISLEVCPLRVAMVTILVLHARKSRGTCWSHHQNLSLKNQQMAFVRNSYFLINLGKRRVCGNADIL